ncbi:hypothetical protein [Arthrobacter psychrolactophilus]
MSEFLEADLIDFLHVAIVPCELGSGVQIGDHLAAVEDRFTIESVGSSSGLTHQLWNRKTRV